MAWRDESGKLRFKFERSDGTEYFGPCYLARSNGEVLLAEDMLLKNGLSDVGEIRYVVAYHWGGFPNGIPVRLLSSLENLDAKYSRF
jgi:hypothetical protein